MTLSFDVVFAGGGLASALAARALRTRFPRLRMALVERGAHLGGNHTWCFHGSDLDERGHALLRPFVTRSWGSSEVVLPGVRRTLATPYHAVISERLDVVVRELFAGEGDLLLTGSTVESVRRDGISLGDGRHLEAELVIDARGPARQDVWEATGFQKFLGLELEVAPRDVRAGDEPRPLLMDATVSQHDGYRFMYVLPFAPTRLLIEETFFSSDPSLDEERSRAAILHYATLAGWQVQRVVREERGLLPMPLPSAAESAPPLGMPLRLGYLGGWFHPATGYSVPIAARVALALADGPLDGAVLRLQALWREHRQQARFAAQLNKLLFRAVAPERRVDVFARFFTLPDETIARFFALRMNRWDRVRLLCGRPPAGMSLGDVLFPKEVAAC